MAIKVDPGLMTDMKKLGAFDVSACYNCGNCTAICPLSVEGHELPRKLIRYALLGMKDKMLSSPEVWLCYFCGECSTTCPRSADPGQFMMSARRYAIRGYSFGRVADLFYNSKILSALALMIFPLILMGAFVTSHGDIVTDRVDMWEFIPMELIHELGLAVMAFLGVSVLANLFMMYRRLDRGEPSEGAKAPSVARRGSIWTKALVTTVVYEVLAQKRFTKCDDNSPKAEVRAGMSKYYAHMALFWGFLGLAGATMMDYGINEYGLEISRDISRVLGIVAGIVMMYGASYFMYKRLKKDEVFSKFSHFSDWVFLFLLFFGGLTGFLVTTFMYAGWAVATYVMLVVHLMFSFDLLITLPFTKFAHAMYRPFAIWLVTARDKVSAETRPSGAE